MCTGSFVPSISAHYVCLSVPALPHRAEREGGEEVKRAGPASTMHVPAVVSSRACVVAASRAIVSRARQAVVVVGGWGAAGLITMQQISISERHYMGAFLNTPLLLSMMVSMVESMGVSSVVDCG